MAAGNKLTLPGAKRQQSDCSASLGFRVAGPGVLHPQCLEYEPNEQGPRSRQGVYEVRSILGNKRWGKWRTYIPL